MKPSMYSLIVTFGLLIFLSSCMVTRTTVGNGPTPSNRQTEVYAKTKQFYLLWGLVPLGYTQPEIPEESDLQVKTSRNILDALITGLTGGIISSQTIKILVKKE